MAITREQVERMEQQAELSDRFNKAADSFVAGNNPRIRAAEREQNLRNRESEISNQAHARFMRSRRNYLERNPNAVSPQEYAATMGYERGKNPTGLWQHELDMLDKQNKGMLDVQTEKTRTAGEAARQTGLTNIELEKLRGGYTDDKGVFHPGSQTLLEREKMKNGLTLAEKQLSSQERIAGMEHGTIGPDGKVIPGSRERVANINADSAYDVADRQGKTAVAVEREKGTQMAAANIREEQVLRWKQQHEKELAQMKLNGEFPSEREVQGLMMLQKSPEYKDMSIAQILKSMRKAMQQ